MIEPLLDAARIVPGSRVLDVGTGPGDLAAAAMARGATVVGIDVANEMVALARRAHRDIEFRQADAERLPFEDGSFDALVGNFVILHLGQREETLSRIRATFNRLVAEYADDGGFAIPVSVKLASGRKPSP